MDEGDVQVRAEEWENPADGVGAFGVVCAVTALMLVLAMLHLLA
ncbi:MAG TPA: hypothetical protein VFW71_01835 [Actinomycetota bacterium]|nr:hypothetical protein [Actinomycetota bacterium]